MTCIDLFDEFDPTQLTESHIGNKGLNKVFPLSLEFVDRKWRYAFDIRKRLLNLSKNLILAGAKKSLLEGFKVEVVLQ